MRNWLNLSWLLISVAGAAQATPPAQLEIEYTLTRNGSSMAEVTDRLEHANGNYQLTEIWRGKGMYALLGKAKRVSQGLLDADGPRPVEYTDERSGRDTQRVTFDWKANTITRRYKGKTGTEGVPPDTQDRLSFLFKLMFVARKPQTLSFHVADGRGMSHHTYTAGGRERVATPAGEFDAVKVTRTNGSGDKAEMWFAADRNYVPVRIVVMEKDGTRYEHLATRIQP
jgi:hypothetical protein